jgi:hypothetical protein
MSKIYRYSAAEKPAILKEPAAGHTQLAIKT